MPLTQSVTDQRNQDLISPLISSLIIVLFLFFIDEGYYDFRWMKEWGSWIVFVMYMIILFPVQWAISHFIFRDFNGWKKTVAMICISIPVSLIFFWIVF